MVGTHLGALMLRAAALGVAGALAMLADCRDLIGATETVAFVAGGYGLSLLLFAAFPRLRRDDLIMTVGGFVLALSLLRYLDGVPHAATPLLFGLAGAAGAWLPSRVERFRREERRVRRRGDRRPSRPSQAVLRTADIQRPAAGG